MHESSYRCWKEKSSSRNKKQVGNNDSVAKCLVIVFFRDNECVSLDSNEFLVRGAFHIMVKVFHEIASGKYFCKGAEHEQMV